MRVPVGQPRPQDRVEPGQQRAGARLRIDFRIDIEHRLVIRQTVAQSRRQLVLARAEKHTHAGTFAA